MNEAIITIVETSEDGYVYTKVYRVEYEGRMSVEPFGDVPGIALSGIDNLVAVEQLKGS